MADKSLKPVLVTERHGAVQLLRLSRPDVRNALDPALVNALGEAVLVAELDEGVRAIVLTGTGDRAFCAGMDLRAFTSGPGQENVVSDAARAAFLRLGNGASTKPVIGAANAAALAGGFELLLGCDLIVASSAATFSLPEAKRGLFASWNGMFLARRIPVAIALELTLIGEAIDATRAYALGLVNRVVPSAEVVPVALALGEKIAANGPLAVAASRELTRLALADPAAAKLRQAELQKAVFASADAQEGARAFVEKRAPVWQGR